MKKVFLIMLTVFVVFGFTACDEGGEKFFFTYDFDGVTQKLEGAPVGSVNPLEEPFIELQFGFGENSLGIVAGKDADNEVSISYSAPVTLYDIFKGDESIDEVIFEVGGTDYFLSTFDITFTQYTLTDIGTGQGEVGIAEGTFEATVTDHTITNGAFRLKIYKNY